MARHLIALAIIFTPSAIVKSDEEIRNTRFPLCVKELLKMAPPDLIKDIELRSPSYAVACYFGLRYSDDVLNREVSPGQYAFDLDLAKKRCDRLGAAVPTIQDEDDQFNANNLEEKENLWEKENYYYALGAEMEFIRNEEKDNVSVWKIKKWDDVRSKHLRDKEIKCSHPANASDAGLLVHKTKTPEKYRVVLNRIGFPYKIHLRCKQDNEKLLANLTSPEPPVTPEPGPSVENVNICNKTSKLMHLPKEMLDRIGSSVQLEVDQKTQPNRCYFQLDQQTMDKANFEFQKGYFRFSFPYARMTCDRYGAQLLSFDTEAEIEHLAKNYQQWKTEEFYAIGANVGKGKRDDKKNHEVSFKDIVLDGVDDAAPVIQPWGYSGIKGVFHTDEKDIAGLVFSQNLGLEHGWFVLQHSVGIYKAVRFICVQNVDKLDQNDPRMVTPDGDWTRPSVTPPTGGDKTPTKDSVTKKVTTDATEKGKSTTGGNGQDGKTTVTKDGPSSKSTPMVFTKTKSTTSNDGSTTGKKGPSPAPPRRKTTSTERKTTSTTTTSTTTSTTQPTTSKSTQDSDGTTIRRAGVSPSRPSRSTTTTKHRDETTKEPGRGGQSPSRPSRPSPSTTTPSKGPAPNQKAPSTVDDKAATSGGGKKFSRMAVAAIAISLAAKVARG